MDGVSPLALACRMGEVGIARLLLEAGADEKLRDNRGMPPIFSLLRYPFQFQHNARKELPIYKNKQDILAMLKEIELTDGEGYTLLMRSKISRPFLPLRKKFPLTPMKPSKHVKIISAWWNLCEELLKI